MTSRTSYVQGACDQPLIGATIGADVRRDGPGARGARGAGGSASEACAGATGS